MSEESVELLNLADEALDDIEKMQDSGVSIRPLYNRLYYGVFYSAKAALISEDVETKTHRGTASQAYQVLYDQKNVIEREEAILLQKLQEKRDIADYELEVNFTKQDFEKHLEKGKDFIQKMREVVEE